MKNYFILFLLLTLNTSCGSDVEEITSIQSEELVDLNIWQQIDDKANWFKLETEYSMDTNDIPHDFLNFYIYFLSDSIKQKESLELNGFVGVISECDTTILLNPNNWEYSNWNFIEHFSVDNDSTNVDGWNNKFYYSNNKFYYEFRLNEVGIIYQVGFERKNNGWKTTLYYVNNC